jgi:hypothetical protein
VPPPPPFGVYPSQVAPPNGLATAALIVGIVGVLTFWTVWLGVILGVLGIVFGSVSRGKTKLGAPNGGQATAGLVLGIVAVGLSVLFVVFIIAANMQGDIALR